MQMSMAYVPMQQYDSSGDVIGCLRKDITREPVIQHNQSSPDHPV